MNFGSPGQLVELMEKLEQYSLASQSLDEKLGETTAALAKVKAYATSLATMLGSDTHTERVSRGRRRHRESTNLEISSRKTRRLVTLQSIKPPNVESDQEMADM